MTKKKKELKLGKNSILHQDEIDELLVAISTGENIKPQDAHKSGECCENKEEIEKLLDKY